MVIRSLPGGQARVGDAGIHDALADAAYAAAVCIAVRDLPDAPDGYLDIYVTRKQLERLVATGLGVLGVE